MTGQNILRSALLALLVLVGLPAVAANAAPEDQVIVDGVIPYYTDWSAAYYSPAYFTSYYRPRVHRPFYRTYLRGYSACWYYYC